MGRHGFARRGKRHPLYVVWFNIVARCENPKSVNYSSYGARGIRICDEWRQDSGRFVTWALDHGYRAGLHIDRIDNDGHYEPSNCRFITPRENTARSTNVVAENRRKTTCKRGHPLKGSNLWIASSGARQCRLCKNERSRRVTAAQRLEKTCARTTCGKPFVPEKTAKQRYCSPECARAEHIRRTTAGKRRLSS